MRFDIYLHGKCIDSVYYDKGFTCEDVRQSLIKHDGYNTAIKVYKHK